MRRGRLPGDDVVDGLGLEKTCPGCSSAICARSVELGDGWSITEGGSWNCQERFARGEKNRKSWIVGCEENQGARGGVRGCFGGGKVWSRGSVARRRRDRRDRRSRLAWGARKHDTRTRA